MIELWRTIYHSRATRGILDLGGGVSLNTIELPWKENRPRESCIPEGTYTLRPHIFDGRYKTALVESVPGRAGIVFHIGNTPTDTDGCILVGRRQGYLNGEPAVFASTDAFKNDFWPRVKDRLPLRLSIRSLPYTDMRNN